MNTDPVTKEPVDLPYYRTVQKLNAEDYEKAQEFGPQF